MATGHLSDDFGPDDLQALLAERDALETRAVEAETLAEQLAGDLMAARRQLAEQAPAPSYEAGDGDDAGRDAPYDVPLVSNARLIGDGSDAGVLPIALLGTALVMALVFALSLVNNGVLSLVTLLFLLITAGLGYGAWLTRVVHTDISIDRGMVHVRRGRNDYHFDLSARRPW